MIDVLNVEHSMQHHWDAYGYWADAVGDYVDMDIMDWLHTPEFRDMMAIVDPYRYADNRLTMPKYIVNSTGDQFFLPDSSQFYFDALKGEKYLRYVPNTDHGLNQEAIENVTAYYTAILTGTPRPEFTWSKQADGSLRVETTTAPSEVRLWQATNPDERNFRLDSIGAAYTSSVLTDQGGGVYIGSVPPPAEGWTAFFVELTFPSGGAFPFKFTTEVVVTPDTLPYRDVGGWGTIETVGSGDDAISLVKVGGSRYEMGYWYGNLLADQIASCWAGMSAVFPASEEEYDWAIESMWNSDYFDIEAWERELRGMADGCADAGYPEVTFRELQKLHMLPDMSEYNCGLFAAWGNATANGDLYQMRNLDWSMNTGAQDYPVVAIYNPDDGEKHAVIGFAGLAGAAIGGINEHGIAESQIMGGFGDAETLDGIPYPMLLRDVIYHDTTLAEALTRMGSATRTNEYYFGISGLDASGDPDARLLFTSNTRFDQFGGGESIVHPEFDPFYEPLEDVVYWKRHDGGAYAMPGEEDHRKGNQTLYAAIEPRWGAIDGQKAKEIAIADGVSSTVVSIVYNATTGTFWVAYAEGTSTPAPERTYIEFNLHEFVEVPTVVGASQPTAETRIMNADLVVGNVASQYSDTVPADNVISQDPVGGTEVAPGSAVDLLISRGPEPTVTSISSIDELQSIGADPAYPLDGYYALTQDIDASATADWNDGAGFEPIGAWNGTEPSSAAFTGAFDGQGHVITNLTISQPDGEYVGLFSATYAEASIQNLVLEDCTVSGKNHVGALVGFNYNSTISGCSATGAVTGTAYAIGGLVGFNQSGRLSECYATAAVTGNAEVGGLVGLNWGGADSMSQCYATGPVVGENAVGGLAGGNWYSALSNCYATASVTGESKVGGLIGENMYGVLSHSYAVGPVTGTGDFVGGLLGQDYETSYETIESCFWDTETSGLTESAGGTGLPTADMQIQSTFTNADWDFDAIWYMLTGGSYPYLLNLSKSTVPNVTNQPEMDAIAALEAAGLTSRISYENSHTVDEGLVVSQDVPDGEDINSGVPIHLVVSLGPESVEVPDVVGMTEAEAETALTDVGLGVGNVTDEYSDTVAEGEVISQSPEAGADVLWGSAVDLVVSLGPEPVTVPNVVGMSQSEAEAALVDAGLTVGAVSEAYSDTVSAEAVIEQTPSAGTEVFSNDAVDLVVSLGPDVVEVPQLVGMTQAAAASALSAARLRVGTVTGEYSDTVVADEVVGQSPEPGTVISSGNAVDLVVSLGPEPVTVPNVVGMSQSHAEAALREAGLAIGAVTEDYSDSISAGNVMSQSPASGAQAPPESAVSLVISRGPDPWPGATAISTIEELQQIGNAPDYPLDGNYYLTQDIDASGTAAWNAGAGFEPIGLGGDHFTGIFDGKDYVISGLAILRTDTSSRDRVGLFGGLGPEGEIRNLGLENAEVEGQYSVGALAGYNEGTISACYAIASVTGEDFAGGLVGLNKGSISRCYATGTVSLSSTNAGGLVGRNEGSVSACYAMATVSGDDGVGGLVGWNASAGAIVHCYATGPVNGNENVGGLIGMNRGGCEAGFWDMDASGMSASDGGTGLSTAEMLTQATFTDADWDFAAVWSLSGAYPVLRQLPQCTLVYEAESDGAIEGPATQTVNRGTSGAPVTAVPAEGFDFVQWSDGATANPRVDTNVTADVSITANFVRLTGALEVLLEPEGAVAAGAQWRLAGTDDWLDSGSIDEDVPAGPQTIEFHDATGWGTPENREITVVVGETTTITATYLAPAGSIMVTILPRDAMDAGAQWRRVGSEEWLDSGTTESGIEPGSYRVEFKPVSGWNEPQDIEDVMVVPNETATLCGVYTTETQPWACPLLDNKALEPFAEASVYEPVMPSPLDENGVRFCAPVAPLAVRLRSNSPIDPATVWGVVSWTEAASEEVLWLPLDAGQSDGWAVYEPETPWADGEVVSFTAGAYTVSGHEVGPFTYEFVVSEEVYEGSVAVIESGATTSEPEFVGSAYEIAPSTVYFEPLKIQLPVPDGVDAAALEPAYLFSEDGGSRWVDGRYVEGWLEGGSVRVVQDEDRVYIEFQVNHGGTVQLRRRATGVSSAGMSNALVSGDLLVFLGLVAFLLFQKRLWDRRLWDRRPRRS
ncbi:MAG: C45 family autoproteolytic acyltransferase/hydrolase [Candidatus Hydrogenedentota bacterium]